MEPIEAVIRFPWLGDWWEAALLLIMKAKHGGP